MKGMDMQESLERLYANWKRSVRFDDNVAKLLSPPLLLSPDPAYVDAKLRIIVFGRETYGWTWNANLRAEYPRYPNDYEFGNLCNMQNFLDNDDAVEALCWGYREFDFARWQPTTWRSPFWRAFRKVQLWRCDVGLTWNNLSRCDYHGGSILKAPEQLRTCLSTLQHNLVHKELDILKPHCCLFFTGPDYDDFLAQVFDGRTNCKIDDIDIRQLARIEHPCLPSRTFRTYHPKYLSYKGLLEQYLEILCKLVHSGY